jgi:hypothetical protein
VAELWINGAPVTHADDARFVAATDHPPPRRWDGGVPPPAREHT